MHEGEDYLEEQNKILRQEEHEIMIQGFIKIKFVTQLINAINFADQRSNARLKTNKQIWIR